MSVIIHPKEHFEKMRAAGKLAAEVLDYIAGFVKPGVTTEHLDKLCHDMILSRGATPAPLGYKGYPKSICTSVNHVVCHGIPDGKILKNGDILNIDVTVNLNGWHGDTSRMFWVGDNISLPAKRLTEVTYNAMMEGIKVVKPGATIGDIGHAIETYVRPFGYTIVEDFCAHGIGEVMHTEPSILHYGKKGTGLVLEPGMFFTVEPMINAGKKGVKISKKDGWTVTTLDYSLSAQFEHTVAVTDDGYEIFTLSPKNMYFPPYNAA